MLDSDWTLLKNKIYVNGWKGKWKEYGDQRQRIDLNMIERNYD